MLLEVIEESILEAVDAFPIFLELLAYSVLLSVLEAIVVIAMLVCIAKLFPRLKMAEYFGFKKGL